MKRHVANWTRWLHWALGASVVLSVGGVAVGAVAGKPRDTTYMALGELRSLTAELAQITHQAGAEQLTATFTRAQTRQLESRLSPLGKDLAQAESQSHAEEARIGRALLDQVVDAARDLPQRAATPSAIAPLERRLARVVDALTPIELRTRP